MDLFSYRFSILLFYDWQLNHCFGSLSCSSVECNLVFTWLPPGGGAKYCSQHVCLSTYMSHKPYSRFYQFEFAVRVHVTCGRVLIIF